MSRGDSPLDHNWLESNPEMFRYVLHELGIAVPPMRARVRVGICVQAGVAHV